MIFKDKEKTLKAERDALISALKIEREKNERLKSDIEDLTRELDREKKRNGKSAEKAASYENAKISEYRLALSALKMFIDKVERFSASGTPVKEKREITEILKGYLTDGDYNVLKTAVDKASAAFESAEDADENFDIDAALSAGDLDLKKLCEEFGVYRG